MSCWMRPQPSVLRSLFQPCQATSAFPSKPTSISHRPLNRLTKPSSPKRSITSLITPTPTLHSPIPTPHPPCISRHLVFALVLGGGSLAAAALYTTAEADERVRRRKEAMGFWFREGGVTTGLDLGLARERMREAGARAAELIRQFPGSRPVQIAAESYCELSETQRTVIGLGAAFGAIFVAWQVPVAQRFMRRWFLADPLKNRPITMLTSIFSHKTFLHLSFNTIALYSIATSTSSFLSFSPDNMLPRSTSRYEFLALFVAAGLASSLASHAWSCKVLIPRLLRAGVGRQGVRERVLPSLGASGSIYGCFAITALAFPDAKVSLIFLPFVPFSIGLAAASMVTLDVAGLVLGWRMFDHAAHLGGAAWGIFWWYAGHAWFEDFRLWLKQI